MGRSGTARAAVFVAAAVVAAVAVGAAGLLGPVRATTSPATATYVLVPRPVRTDEMPLHLAPVKSGDTMFEFVGLTPGQPTVIGSHADWPAKGQFVRIRVAATNTGRTTVLFDTRHQVLVASDGTQAHPDDQAMLIKRQPADVDLGSGVRLEFDLWFDIPAGTHASVLRVFGGGSLTDLGDDRSVDVPLPPGL